MDVLPVSQLPKEKKKRNRTFTPEQKAALLAQLSEARKKSVEVRKKKKDSHTTQALPEPTPQLPEPIPQPVPQLPQPLPQDEKPILIRANQTHAFFKSLY